MILPSYKKFCGQKIFSFEPLEVVSTWDSIFLWKICSAESTWFRVTSPITLLPSLSAVKAMLDLIANDCSVIPQRPEKNYEWTLLIKWKYFQPYDMFKSFNLSHWMAPLHFCIYKRKLLFECLLQPLWSWRKKRGKKQSCYLTASINPSKSYLTFFI